MNVLKNIFKRTKREESLIPKQTEENVDTRHDPKRTLTRPKKNTSLLDTNISLPEFNEYMVDYWFHIVEEIFKMYDIQSDELKLSLVIAKLDWKHLALVQSELIHLNTNTKYERVKNKLMGKIDIN